MTVTVQELINELNSVKNKSLPIFGFMIDKRLINISGEYAIDELADRVDINLMEECI